MRGYRIPALAVVGGLLLLAVLSARGLTAVSSDPAPITIAPRERKVSGEGEQQRPLEVDQVEPGMTSVVASIVLALVVLLVVAGVVLLVFRELRRRPRPPRAEPVTGEEAPADLHQRFREAAELAHHELTARAGGPPGDAVVAAWLVLEEAAAREGTARAPSQTSTEFTASLLGTLTTDERALNQLRALYQRARFAPTPTLTTDDVTAARTALEHVLHGIPTPTSS